MNELITRVYEHNSSEKNTVCCIEEMSELTKVLTKKLRNSDKFNEMKLLEEVSHVLLMCSAIAKEYNFTEEDILRMQIDAVERMENEDGNN